MTVVVSGSNGTCSAFSADHELLARIEQMIARGRLQDRKASGLVQKLLDRGEANSPRMLNALAGMRSEGIGIERDAARGAEVLMAAGHGGNADALLTLSNLAVAGQAPDGWDSSPDLAVTMAFGSLVGQMDPLICDRIARIARESSSGEVVAVDHGQAVRWSRFAGRPCRCVAGGGIPPAIRTGHQGQRCSADLPDQGRQRKPALCAGRAGSL